MQISFAKGFAAVLVVLGLGAPAARAETVLMLPAQSVLASADAKEKLDGSVSFYFGKTVHPAVVASFGEYVANRKTNGVGKKDEVACAWAMLSALIALQEEAKSRGADAVINIRSFYKKQEVVSDTQYECHSGNIMVGVALKGDMVKLRR